jgi:predicted nucleic acid-binding protein
MDDLTLDADLDHHLFRTNSRGSRPIYAAAYTMASLLCFTAPTFLLEYQEKLIAKQIHLERRLGFLSSLIAKGLSVNLVPAEIVPRVLADPDDDVVLACALIGGATHLVTYDPHLLTLEETYRQQVCILDGLHFLYALRGDTPPVAGFI